VTAANVPGQVHRAWTELLAAAREAGYAVGELVRPPATAAQVAAAEEAIGCRLPPDLTLLYQMSDGQADWTDLVRDPGRERGRWVGSLFGAGWTFSTLQQLQTDYRGWADIRAYYTPAELAEDFDSVIEVRGGDPVKPLYTCAGWIPFATDGGGNSLAVDLAPQPGGTPGQVIVIGPDEDLRRVLAPCVRALLRLCATRLREPDTAPRAERSVAVYILEPGQP
jgi:cell wall assembly regulator SMI1